MANEGKNLRKLGLAEVFFMHTSKPKDTNGASGAPSPEATGSVSGEKKRVARLNAECALLARIIIDGGGELLDAAERRALTPADFFFPMPAAIFNAIQKLRRAEKNIAVAAVCEELIRAGSDRGWAKFNIGIVLQKKTRRSAALRALDAIKPPHLPPTIEAQTAAPADITEADDRALRFAAELRAARAAAEKARNELEQLRARVKALTAENARLTAELSRLMAFVPEEALTDAQPTITEKTDAQEHS